LQERIFSGSILTVVGSGRDHLDGILEQWRRERPDLDVGSIGVLGRLLRFAHLADPVLATAVRPFGLQAGWFDLLAALRRAGSPFQLNPTELARATMLTSGGMTKRLDRLEQAGLVERRPDPDDRRGTLVRLTRRGRSVIDRALEAHVQNEGRVLASLSPAEMQTLDSLLRKLLAAIER
jgi:DNA-binding MarR family transcriptional regulator